MKFLDLPFIWSESENNMTIYNIFELLMLVLFGISWPVSIYKSYTKRINGSKSIIFLFAVICGYVCGIINKFVNTPNYVTIFYFFNLTMVSIDAGLYFRNRKFENLKNNNK